MKKQIMIVFKIDDETMDGDFIKHELEQKLNNYGIKAETMESYLPEIFVHGKDRTDTLISFLNYAFPDKIQTFFCHGIDETDTIYDDEGITVEYSHYWGYIEIFGLTDEEQKRVINDGFNSFANAAPHC